MSLLTGPSNQFTWMFTLRLIQEWLGGGCSDMSLNVVTQMTYSLELSVFPVQGPGECLNCENFKDGPFCVSSCPQGKKYAGTDRLCRACPAECKGGCTGDRTSPGPGGCTACWLGTMSNSGTIVSAKRVLCVFKLLKGSEEEKTCFKTSDKDGNVGRLRDVSPSQGLLQSASPGSYWNAFLWKKLLKRNALHPPPPQQH